MAAVLNKPLTTNLVADQNNPAIGLIGAHNPFLFILNTLQVDDRNIEEMQLVDIAQSSNILCLTEQILQDTGEYIAISATAQNKDHINQYITQPSTVENLHIVPDIQTMSVYDNKIDNIIEIYEGENREHIAEVEYTHKKFAVNDDPMQIYQPNQKQDINIDIQYENNTKHNIEKRKEEPVIKDGSLIEESQSQYEEPQEKQIDQNLIMHNNINTPIQLMTNNTSLLDNAENEINAHEDESNMVYIEAKTAPSLPKIMVIKSSDNDEHQSSQIFKEARIEPLEEFESVISKHEILTLDTSDALEPQQILLNNQAHFALSHNQPQALDTKAQVAEHVHVAIQTHKEIGDEKQISVMRVELHPKELGHIEITVREVGEVHHVTVKVESQNTHDLLSKSNMIDFVQDTMAGQIKQCEVKIILAAEQSQLYNEGSGALDSKGGTNNNSDTTGAGADSSFNRSRGNAHNTDTSNHIEDNKFDILYNANNYILDMLV